jgi:leucyl-tRNA synthetase
MAPAPESVTGSAAAAPRPTKRRDALLVLQEAAQAKWGAAAMFEEDAPDATGAGEEKFLATFPYPYSNGFLHLGHAFTVSKAEFAVGYKRLTGVRCLFPFAFHTTGMPIQACANKLRKEIELFGNPPVFPDAAEEPAVDAATAGDVGDAGGAGKRGKSKGKVASKASALKYQWQILRESGVPEEIIASFADPHAWLGYFPPRGVAHLKRMGLKADWRRSFITTDVNPYYDSFVRWQFNTLRALHKIKFGKRHAVFSTVDNQACADHDRSAGEGVMPQEYTLIKMKLMERPAGPEAARVFEGRDVYLPAATLRAETMYGQTNCWVLPTGTYHAYEVVGGDIFITSEHSARNMAYQDMLPTYGVAKPLATFTGQDLIGLPVASPKAAYDVVYVLPLLTVSMTKGTGIVTSVPSDAPDDYRGLMDLKEKGALRAKFGVKDEWVMRFVPVPIIESPGFGSLAAVEACERYKIKSQNDKDALAKAKEEVYKAGFYSGTMLVGSMQGEPVQSAKPRIREELIAAREALSYSEPESRVVDRNGSECVVALCDQWYLEYGEREWRAQAEVCLAGMELYADETRKAFVSVLDWLKEWACSRSFGLGTKLPWDAEWIIESLSDSTIYMAYYTVAHLLQGGTDNLDGKKTGPCGIPPEQMTDAAWDYVLLGKVRAGGGEAVDAATLGKLRKEFLYWYPVDLRVSGKDLVGNHLSFFIYNHVAIFGKEHWPRSIRSNGHVTLDAEKMSKSTGNFITLDQAIDLYTADGVRFALADAGDTVEDANFSKKTADDAVLKLSTLVDFVEDGVRVQDSMRSGPLSTFHDRVFDSKISERVRGAEAAYEGFLFRDALKVCYHEFSHDFGRYREAVGSDKTSASYGNLHRDLFLRYVEYQAIMLAPICPHTAEHIWGLVAPLATAGDGAPRPDSIMRARWPAPRAPDAALLAADDYLLELLSRIRGSLLKPAAKRRKGKEDSAVDLPRDSVTVFVCDEPPLWQSISLRLLRERFDADAWGAAKAANPSDRSQWWTYPADTPKVVTAALPADMPKRTKAKVMPYVAMIRKEVESGGGAEAFNLTLPFDERAVLNENLPYIHEALKPLSLTSVKIVSESAPEGVTEALPGVPGFYFSSSAAAAPPVED